MTELPPASLLVDPARPAGGSSGLLVVRFMCPMSDQHQEIKKKYGLARGLGVLEATALNMTNMVGFGPFITIPLIILAMGGLAGTILAICDGMVWSELATAMPGSGGSYLFLKESFKTSRLGLLLPFLFIWQFIVSGPLEVGSAYIGFAQYSTYFFPALQPWQNRVLVVGLGVLAIACSIARSVQSAS